MLAQRQYVHRDARGAEAAAQRTNTGWVYVTDRRSDHWSALPSYWTKLLRAQWMLATRIGHYPHADVQGVGHRSGTTRENTEQSHSPCPGVFFDYSRLCFFSMGKRK
ncbi:MAG: hypothetical protein R3E55_05465 [Burkholderiaceae bacterium]